MNWSSFRPGGGGFRCLRPAGRLLGYRGDTALTPGWLGNSLGTQLLASVSSPHIYVS